jgi:hypothetical protein
VLEALEVGSGTTGYSTGNLYATLDEGLHHDLGRDFTQILLVHSQRSPRRGRGRIRSKWNADIAKAVAQSRRETVDSIERVVAEYRISCEFARRPHYTFALDSRQA